VKLAGRARDAFRQNLRRWYAKHQRAMSWRGTRDAYRIWVSEIMLQQTRVAAVEPYYRRFMRRFPNVRALARAREEEVLRHWAGLGYYSRARNLHRAARRIVAQHGGKFPLTREAALALPGIGEYTSAAVLSIAYGEPLAVLDGNVARVLARLGALRDDIREPRRWRALHTTAQALLDARAPGEWNQAMMELGATVCTPRAPRCVECPVARWCRARAMGIAEQVPRVRKKRAAEKVTIAAAVLVDPAMRTLLVRQNGGLFSGMWQFPAVEVKQDAEAELRARLKYKGKRLTQRAQGAQRARQKTDGQARRKPELVALRGVRHSVTYREITLVPFLKRVQQLADGNGREAGRASRVVWLEGIGGLAVSSATRKIARAAREYLKGAC
jgi:A/G-specific adenine glycosylase